MLCLSRDCVNCVAFKPDNPNIVVSASDDKTIKTWNITSGSCLSTLSCDSAVLSVDLHDNCIAAGDADGKICVFDAAAGKIKSSLKVGGDVPSIDFAPCGNKFAIACNNYLSSSYSVQIFSQDGSTGNFVCQSTLKAHSSLVLSVSWSPCGQWLASGGADKMVYIYDAKTFEVKWPLKAHSGWVKAVAWSPCGQWLTSGGHDKMIYVYDAKTFEVKWPLRGHTDVVTSVCFSSDGKKLTSGSEDSTVRNWNPATRASLS